MSKPLSAKSNFDLSTMVKTWRIKLDDIPGPTNSILSPVMLVLAFALLILIGAVLLILPISHAKGEVTPLMDALFTSTSAVCVTGLTIHDTGTYWSFFGQAVILILIQLGGLGFMSGATILILIFGQRIGLRERLFISNAVGVSKLGGLGTLLAQITLFTVIAEGLGALIFYLHFSNIGMHTNTAWQAVFQSVSAFNNAGFDLFGNNRSLLDFQSDTLLLITTAALVILGGIGFMLVVDVLGRRNFVRLALNNKIVLITTGLLLLFGTAMILVLEYFNSGTLGDMDLAQKFMVAFFQAASARTAGFAAVDMQNLTQYCIFFMIVLMFIGGASGSTAGGIKVNTFGILIATIWSVIRGREHAGAFGKEFIPQQIYRALAVIMLALGIVTAVVLLLTMTEESNFLPLLFEAVSAFSNTGLSIGVTPNLSDAGRIVIVLTMFTGRLGTLVLTLLLVQQQRPTLYRFPREAMTIG
jgi:trk system potassium uptake protein